MRDTVKNVIISVTGGGASFFSIETVYGALLSVIIGITVTVCSFLIIHEIQKIFKKNNK